MPSMHEYLPVCVIDSNTDWMLITARFEFEDKKEYLNELSKQQFDLAATTHYTTNRSEVQYIAYGLPDLACLVWFA